MAAYTNFKEISAGEFSKNPFTCIGQQWALVSCGNAKQCNTMTVSWGGMGVLWNKNVAFIFIRPQRYTEEFLSVNDTFTLSFFPEQNREILKFCGAKSGRDCNKIAETGLMPVFENDSIYFEQAETVLVCKKLYRQPFAQEYIIQKDIEKNYANNDYHIMYVGEIEKILVK